MGDFDFLGGSSGPARRTVVVRHQRQGGCLPVLQVALGILLAVFILVGGCVFMAGLGIKQLADEQARNGGKTFLQKVQDDVAGDAIRQYNVVVDNGGTNADAYVRAGLVAEAFLQAGDDANYRKWKKIRDVHAKRAGLVVP